MHIASEGSTSTLRGSGTEQIRNDRNNVVVNVPKFIVRRSEQFCLSV